MTMAPGRADAMAIRRRGITVLIGSVLVAALTYLVLNSPVPYVEYTPGPTFDTLGKTDGKDVVTIRGTTTYPSSGKLLFVTIGLISDMNLLEAIRGWWSGDRAVIPREFVFPPNKSVDQVNEESSQEFKDSQSSAETAALTRLGYPTQVQVDEITKGLPADGVLEPGDVIVSVDGTRIAFAQALIDLVRSKPVGTTLTFAIRRGSAAQTVRLTTTKGEDGKSRVGVVPKQVQPHPFSIGIPVENIGGPSAGLMLALGIMDRLGPEDLTGGKVIAGTGAIDDTGKVGPIGGIAEKIQAAKGSGATIFLSPKDNCAEAVANAVPGLELVQVSSLDDALAALNLIGSGQRPTLCPGAR
jgi:Lon-like protease